MGGAVTMMARVYMRAGRQVNCAGSGAANARWHSGRESGQIAPML